MKLCESYHCKTNIFDGDYVGECWATKECEPTYCQGDRTKCQFYSEIAKQAKREQEQEKIESASPVQKTLDRNEIIDIVNIAAQKLNARVSPEFYERMFRCD